MNFDYPVAEDDVVLHSLAAQVKIAILQTEAFLYLGILVDIEGRGAEGLRISVRLAMISISPVGSLRFSVPAGRRATSP